MDTLNKILKSLSRKGKEADFKLLYMHLYDSFFRTAFYYTKKDEWAQEIVQDVFMALWNRKEGLWAIGKFESYCFILLKNASLNYIQKNKNSRLDLENIESLPEQVSNNTTPEKHMLDEELLYAYIKALNQLPEKCKEIYILVKEQEMSYKEVSEQLGISTKTVDAQLQKAGKIMKEKMRDYLNS